MMPPSTLPSKLWWLFIRVSRIGVGVIFIITSIWKLQYPFDFLQTIYNYELLGTTACIALAYTIPWLELVIGLCLVANYFEFGSTIIAIGLLFCFAAAQGIALSQGAKIPCGCSAPDSDLLSLSDLVRTISLLVIAGLSLVMAIRFPTTELRSQGQRLSTEKLNS